MNMSDQKKYFYNNPDINLVSPEDWDKSKKIPVLLKTKLANICSLDPQEIEIEHPKDSSHGDYSTNIALKLAKEQGSNPRELAQEFLEKLNNGNSLNGIINKIDVAGPGFINFYVASEYLSSVVKSILKEGNSFGKQETLKGKRILFEYAHPNPFKVFHIGHLRNITLGESLIRFLEGSGAEVIRTNYQGDVGMHVAKSIWGMIKIMEEENLTLENFLDKNSRERVSFLGRSYAKGAKAYNDNCASNDEIKDVNHIVYAVAQELETEKYNWSPKVKYKDFIKSKDFSFEQIKELWVTGVEWSLTYLRRRIYKRLYSSFEREYMESETQYYSEQNIEKAKDVGILEKSDGAYVFKGKQFGLDTRVFVNSLGLPTYEGKELGLAPLEATDFGDIDLFIHNVAVEQISYFKVVFKVLGLLDKKKYEGKKYHNAYEFVGLKSGKMSSRTGDVVTAEDIIDEAKSRILDLIEDRSEISEDVKNDVAEKITIGAIKYSFLNISPFSYLAFDFDSSLTFEGNSGPYLQYTYARANRVVEDSDLNLSNTSVVIEDLLTEGAEIDVLRKLSLYEEIVIDSTKTLMPNTLCTYLFELAQSYNSFYKSFPILKIEDEKLKKARLLLTKATLQVLQNGLNLLGIKTVERM